MLSTRNPIRSSSILTHVHSEVRDQSSRVAHGANDPMVNARSQRNILQGITIPLSLGLLVIGVSGCAAGGDTARRLNAIDLSQVAAVVTTAEPEDHSPFTDNNKGYVSFIKSDGSIERIDISSVRNQGISWEEDALFFADRDRDYFLRGGEEAIIHDSLKTDVGDAIVALPDGKRVNLLNGGFTSNRNRYDEFDEQVIISTLSGSEKRSLGKWTRNAAVCGDDVYGFGLQSEKGANEQSVFHPELMEIHTFLDFLLLLLQNI